MYFDRDRRPNELNDEACKGPFSGFGSRRPRTHQYLFASPGFQEARIFQRIRQGSGGPTYLEHGAEVIGHVHIPAEQPFSVNDIVPMKFDNQGIVEAWEVRITDISPKTFGDKSPMIFQDDPDDTGYHIQGVCVRQIQ